MKDDEAQLGQAAQEDDTEKGEGVCNSHGKLKRAVKAS
jgi:hypothetical protein